MPLRTLIIPTATLLLALGLAACSPRASEDPRAVADLVAAFAVAELEHEPTGIDFGTPEAYAFLLDGWSWNEASHGTTYTWGMGSASAVRFHLNSPRRLSIRVRCMPFSFPGASTQTVELFANGELAASLSLADGWRQYDVDLPTELLRAGPNRLEFRYARADSPASRGLGTDTRNLAVAWESIQFGNPGRTGTAPRAAGDAIILPYGAQVDYYLDLPPRAHLAFAATESSAPGRLLVSLTLDRGDGGGSWELAPGADARLLLTESGGLGRLRFQAEPSTAGRGGEMRLLGATVETAHHESGPAAAPPGDALCGERPEHIFLYMVDTLRADRLSTHGYDDEITPRLAAFAAEASLFTRASSPSSWTKASVASLFTGLWPPDHGVNSVEAAMPADLPTLPSKLRAAGYRTVGVSANAYVSESFGFGRGFDEFVNQPQEAVTATDVQRTAWSFVDARPPGERHFLYLHTIDPHAPYRPPSKHAARWAPDVADASIGSNESLKAIARVGAEIPDGTSVDLSALYDAEVAFVDEQFGTFLDELVERGIYDSSLLAVVADHGEEFFEHGRWTHGQSLHQEVIHVPLLLKLPGQRSGRRVETPVELASLFATILECVGVEGVTADGLPLREGAETGRPRPVFSFLDYFNNAGVSVVSGDWKLIARRPGALSVDRQLFDLAADPAEQRDLAAERPVLVGFLTSLIRARMAQSSGAAAESVELDNETREQLRALGYLN